MLKEYKKYCNIFNLKECDYKTLKMFLSCGITSTTYHYIDTDNAEVIKKVCI